MSKKSRICKSGRGPLTEYDSQSDAQYACDELYNKATPYRCQKCSKWHISFAPKCLACGKNQYPDEVAAKKEAQNAKQIGGRSLSAYSCPRGNGWHLTTSRG